MNKLGYVSKPRLCMCLTENADICTMRKGRGCHPAIINMEYEILSEDEFNSINGIEALKRSVEQFTKEMEGIPSVRVR